MKPRVLVTGGGGIVGSTWQHAAPTADMELRVAGRSTLDITDERQVREAVDAFKPHFIVNAAAFTRVDDAETQREQAYRVNVTGAEILARQAERTGAVLIHYSTDYVFDGKRRQPYREDDPANPLNYYGLTKWLGEEKIRKTIQKHYIIRTAWVYGGFGHNFIRLVLNLAARHKTLRFVNDQTGSPTAADDLTDFTSFLIRNADAPFGTYHCSHLGEITRYDQARFIVRTMGLDTEILPVPASYFNPPALRPPYSVLSKEKIIHLLNCRPKNWESGLYDTLKKYYL